MIEHVIGDAATKGDSFGLVEGPMNTKINPALAVLLLCLGKRLEAAGLERSWSAVVAVRHTVELVRYEHEWDFIRPVEVAQRLKERAAEPCMARGVGREWRREIRPCEVAGGRAQRREARIAVGRRIAIARARRTRPRIGLADSGDGPPELVEVLRFPDGDPGVRHGHVHQSQEPRQLDGIRSHLLRDLSDDLVVEPRGRAEARGSIVGPEESHAGPIGGAIRGRGDAIAAQTLDLIVGRCICRAVEGRRGGDPEL